MRRWAIRLFALLALVASLYLIGVDRIESVINRIVYGALGYGSLVPEDGWISLVGDPYIPHRRPKDGEVKILGYDSDRCVWMTYWVPCNSPDAIVPDESFCDECFKAGYSCDGGESWVRTKEIPFDIWLPGRTLSTEKITYQIVPASEGLRRKWRNESDWTHVRPRFGNSDYSYTHLDLLAVSPVDPLKLFVALRSSDAALPRGLYLSVDGGATFEFLREGSPGHTNGRASYATVAVDPFSPQVILAQYGRGIIRSQDHGKTWETMRDAYTGLLSPLVPLLAIPHANWKIEPYVSSILFDRKRKGHVFAASNKGLLFSDDHGRSWRIVNLGSRNFNPQLTIADDPDRDAFYVGTRRGLLRSTDGGRTWNRLRLGDERSFWARLLPIVPCSEERK